MFPNLLHSLHMFEILYLLLICFRVRSTCRDVTEYALSNYKSSDICASCISFIELLGQDSLPLRSCLIAANMLHDSRMEDGDSDYDRSFPDIGKFLHH